MTENPDIPVVEDQIASDRPLAELSCISKEWDEFYLETCYDNEQQEVVFRTEIPDNSWFAIGFGSTMEDTDMIAWFADNGTGRTVDYWSTSYV